MNMRSYICMSTLGIKLIIQHYSETWVKLGPYSSQVICSWGKCGKMTSLSGNPIRLEGHRSAPHHGLLWRFVQRFELRQL